MDFLSGLSPKRRVAFALAVVIVIVSVVLGFLWWHNKIPASMSSREQKNRGTLARVMSKQKNNLYS